MDDAGPPTYQSVTSRACLLHLLGDAAAARAMLMKAELTVDMMHGVDPAAPPGLWVMAYRSLADSRLPSPEVMAGAPPLHRAPVHFFHGVIALGQGDRAAAQAHLTSCENCYDYEQYSYLARMIRRRLDADPAWPNWLRGHVAR